MSSRDRVMALRWTLFALLLALPITVVCHKKVCFEGCEEEVVLPPATYETGFGCGDGDVTVIAGTASDVADEDDCFAGTEASASDTIGGVGAEVALLTEYGGENVTLTCAYQIGATLTDALTCAGATLRPARFFFQSAGAPVHYAITARFDALADGEDAGRFDPRVFITCPGVAEVEYDFDGPAYTTPDLPEQDTDCAIRVVMNSEARAAGATHHAVTLSLNGFASCSNDADCPEGLRCASNRRCQDGGVGDLCSSSHLPTGGGDCSAAAPVCVSGPGLVSPRCSDGADGRGCADASHCIGSRCIPVIFGIGICQDGSAGDACLSASDCDAGCSCVAAGSAGICAGDCAPFGDRGAFCTTPADCNLPFGCVSLGTQSICFRCTTDAHCDSGAGEVCVAGQCEFGP